MKKIVSLVLAMAVLVSMFAVVVPVSAVTPSIVLSKNAIAINEDGSYGELTVTISGVSNDNGPWIGIVPKAGFTGTYESGSHYGWFDLTGAAHSDGTVVDISMDARVDSAKGTMKYNTEYLVILVNDSNTVVAQADLKTTAGYMGLTTAGVGLSASPSDALILNQAGAQVTTYFDAPGMFSAVAFKGWSSAGHSWKFELIKVGTTESVVYTTTAVVNENVQVTISFPEQSAGKYGFRISAIDSYTAGYLYLPVANVSAGNTYTVINDKVTNVTGVSEKTRAGALGIYMTGSMPDASITLSTDTVKVEKDGSFTLSADVVDAPTWQSWIGIYNKEELAAHGGDHNATKHYGWYYVQGVSSPDKNVIVPFDKTVDLSFNKKLSASKGAMKNGEYVVVLFEADGMDGATGYNAIATDEFTAICGFEQIAEQGLSLNLGTDGITTYQCWLTTSGASVTTSFTALGDFDSIGFTAWAKGTAEFKFEILNEQSTVVATATKSDFVEGQFATVPFSSVIPAGKYSLRVTAPDNVSATGPYLVLPMRPPVDSTAVSTLGTGEGYGDGVSAAAAGNVVAFGYHLYECSHGLGDSFGPFAGDCKDKSYAEYSKCGECGQLFDEDGNEIDEIPYGDVNPNVHKTPDTFKYQKIAGDAVNHKKLYACCDAVAAATEAHVFGSDDICDLCQYDNTHYCGNGTERTGFAADCGTQTDGQETYYECSCGLKYWDEDCTEPVANASELVIAWSHSGTATNIVSNQNGTHDVKYTGCGHVANDDVTCTGGTANCKDKKVCEICETAYGDIDVTVHKTPDTFKYQKIVGDAVNHKKLYACCDAVAAATEAHVNGNDDICDLCQYDNTHYCGDGTERTGSAADCGTQTNGQKTYYECDCGIKYWNQECSDPVDNDSEIVIPWSHTGGVADCRTPAICTECENPYGDEDADNHASDDYAYVDNEDGTHQKMHVCCEALVVASEEHTYGDDNICDLCEAVKVDGNPSTSDGSQAVIWLALLTVSAAAVLVLGYFRKKKEQE